MVTPSGRTRFNRITFSRFAWGLLAYNLVVIAWGAFVRHSGSGDGCGSHWPDCNGLVIPLEATTKTLIEFSHRVTSGLALLFAIALYFASRAVFEAGSGVRRAALGAVGFTVVSALIGWALVRYGLVAQDDSMARAIVLSIHLVNTFLILACLALAAFGATADERGSLRGTSGVGWLIAFALFGVGLVGVSGAVTSLGDTLFPAKNSAQVLWDSLTPTAHFLVRLRLWHPLLACMAGVFLLFWCAILGDVRPDERLVKRLRLVATIVVLQLLLGLSTVWLKAPTLMAIAHLLLADILWVAVVLASAQAVMHGIARKGAQHRGAEVTA